jgi:hypothetical protein
MTKVCVQCLKTKDTNDFHKKRIGADGAVQYQSRCKVCHIARCSTYNKQHRPQACAAFRKWLSKNKGYKSPCKFDPAYKKHESRVRAAWAASHPDKQANYRHRDRYKRRTILQNIGNAYTPAQWKTLKHAFGNICLCCGIGESALHATGRKLVADHVKAVARGGSNDIGNIQPLCHGKGGCNNIKHAKFIDFRPLFLLLVASQKGSLL